MYKIIDIHTREQVGTQYKTLKRASKRVDKLDNEYGSHKYTVMRIWGK